MYVFLDLGALNFFKSSLLNLEFLKLCFHFSNYKESIILLLIVYILKSTIIYDVLLNGTFLIKEDTFSSQLIMTLSKK